MVAADPLPAYPIVASFFLSTQPPGELDPFPPLPDPWERDGEDGGEEAAHWRRTRPGSLFVAVSLCSLSRASAVLASVCSPSRAYAVFRDGVL